MHEEAAGGSGKHTRFLGGIELAAVLDDESKLSIMNDDDLADWLLTTTTTEAAALFSLFISMMIVVVSFKILKSTSIFLQSKQTTNSNRCDQLSSYVMGKGKAEMKMVI